MSLVGTPMALDHRGPINLFIKTGVNRLLISLPCLIWFLSLPHRPVTVGAAGFSAARGWFLVQSVEL